MKSLERLISRKIKDNSITKVSVLLIVMLFLILTIVLYRTFTYNADFLQRELNLSVNSIYQIDLNRRVKQIWKQSEQTSEFESQKLYMLNSILENGNTFEEDKDIVNSIYLELEESISQIIPINLNKLDSISAIVLEKNNINFSFYCEIVDLRANKVLSADGSKSNHRILLMNSEEIPLNLERSKILRLVLIDPIIKGPIVNAFLLLLCFFISFLLLYSSYYRYRTFSKQKKLEDMKNDLFADILHEMKKPLSLISNAVSSFENEEILTNHEKRNRNLKIVRSELDWISNQTDMMLSLEMDNQGIFDLNCVEFDLGELVSGLADKYMFTSNKRVNINIINELDYPYIYADQEHIEHLISNLVTNSIKYSNGSVTIVVKLYRDKDYLVISIKDNSIGMSVEQQSQVFNKFFRAGELSEVKGHGIGLNYVKRIVEKHKGAISLESELGKGSEFTIRLPQPIRRR